MRSKTQAIVLHLTKHSDSTSIVHLYTRDFGRIDYLVYGLGSKRGKMKKAIFEPLSILDIEVNHQPTKQLQKIEDIHLTEVNHSIGTDIRKQSICMFIAEVLYRSLKHPMQDIQLFDFLILSIQTLEQCAEPQNFHLAFLLRLTQFLGFYPNTDSQGQWFDLQTGEKTFGPLLHQEFMTEEETQLFEALELSEDITAADICFSRQQRSALLNKLITYYSLHLEGFSTPKSLDVLASVFD